jgi:hypothetical protein
MSTNADAHDPDGAQDANHTADQTPRALDTVLVAGYEPCPTCFSGAGGDDA